MITQKITVNKFPNAKGETVFQVMLETGPICRETDEETALKIARELFYKSHHSTLKLWDYWTGQETYLSAFE